MRTDLTRALVKTIHAIIDCPGDCSECCRVGWAAAVAEDGSISDFEMASPEGNEVCSYLSLETGKCECYDDRHFYCAIYFKVEGHPPCNRGLRPDKPIPAAEGREMVKIYKWLIEQKCTE